MQESKKVKKAVSGYSFRAEGPRADSRYSSLLEFKESVIFALLLLHPIKKWSHFRSIFFRDFWVEQSWSNSRFSHIFGRVWHSLTVCHPFMVCLSSPVFFETFALSPPIFLGLFRKKGPKVFKTLQKKTPFVVGSSVAVGLLGCFFHAVGLHRSKKKRRRHKSSRRGSILKWSGWPSLRWWERSQGWPWGKLGTSSNSTKMPLKRGYMWIVPKRVFGDQIFFSIHTLDLSPSQIFQ